MRKPEINRQTVIDMYLSGLKAAKIARELDVGESSIYQMIKDYKDNGAPKTEPIINRVLPQCITRTLLNGMVVFSGDEHVRPNRKSVAHEGYLRFLKKYKPDIVVSDGDFTDFASISVHDADGWENRATVAEELAAGMAFLKEVQSLSKQADHILLQGNHDCRFNKFLAKHVPQLKGVPGLDISDHLPKGWEYAVRLIINDNTECVHAWHGGINAAWNNTLKSGRSFVTGHTHLLDVRVCTDSNGARFGVQTGTLADIPNNAFFNYTHGTPLNWNSGFVVLTYINGELQYPEIAWVNKQGQVIFRGKVL